jgi:hypothetical protein
MNIVEAIKSCSRENWASAMKWLLFTVGVGFTPTYVGVLLILVFSKEPIPWRDFVVHGELAIYSAGAIATSTRLVSKDLDRPFAHRELFILSAVLSLISAITVYSGTKSASFFKQPINDDFIVRFSLPLLVFSVFFGFIVFLLDNQRSAPNVREIAQQQEDKLSKEFDNMKEDSR